MDALYFNYNISFGCDAEFFFSNKGEVLGSEKVLPEEGFIYKPGTADKRDGAHTCTGTLRESKVAIDGVQAEIQPRSNTCRANLANEISCCFRDLYQRLLKDKEGLGINFNPVVKISEQEMQSLSEKSKQFGCAPSVNVYKKRQSKIKIDASKVYSRSAGGHIHLGSLGTYDDAVKKALSEPKHIVPMLDIIVGNTCVLIDRDESNGERRRLYGKVGEYRIKPYGIEYRTLSNFWLRSYQLMSLVFGLARIAVHATSQNDPTNPRRKYVEAVMGAVSAARIKKAIQKNDFDIALENFKKIEQVICEMTSNRTDGYPITQTYLPYFHYFVQKVKEQGMNYWFNEEPLKHWAELPEGHGTGWETFLSSRVQTEYHRSKLPKVGVDEAACI